MRKIDADHFDFLRNEAQSLLHFAYGAKLEFGRGGPAPQAS